MQALGRQVLVEFYNCDSEILNDRELIREVVLEGTLRSGATIISDSFHEFNPHGISGVVVIGESHVAIHTWPEYQYAAVDIFTCGETIDPWVIQQYLEKELKAVNVSSMELKRGLFSMPVTHKPQHEQEVIAKS